MTEQSAKTVLIVDDEATLRELIAEVLGDEGYRSIQADTGRVALDYLREHPDGPCLILLDLMMPETTGIEFLIERQADPVLARIPVAMMTGNTQLIRAGEFLGVTTFLEKPFEISDLIELVDRLCSGERV